MISYLRGLVPEGLWPIVFVAVFLAIGGAALYLTPRIARWLDSGAKKNPGYFDGMMTEPPQESEADLGREDNENNRKE